MSVALCSSFCQAAATTRRRVVHRRAVDKGALHSYGVGAADDRFYRGGDVRPASASATIHKPGWVGSPFGLTSATANGQADRGHRPPRWLTKGVTHSGVDAITGAAGTGQEQFAYLRAADRGQADEQQVRLLTGLQPMLGSELRNLASLPNAGLAFQ
jgi:hypothetical protein